jgi:hypothetical protein
LPDATSDELPRLVVTPGLYVCRVVQLYDPARAMSNEVFDQAEPHFLFEIEPMTAATDPWTEVPWFQVPSDTMTLEEEQLPIDKEIVDAAIISTPEDWTQIELKVERIIHGDDRESHRYTLTRLDGSPKTATPSDELFEATRKLDRLFKRYALPWKSVRYVIRPEPGGSCTYTADFEYPK